MKLFYGYLHGQIASVAKYAVWWTLLSPFILALFHGHIFSIAISRTIFNLALLILSPFTSIISEYSEFRTILTLSTVLRAIIYTVILPLSWLFLQSGLYIFPICDQLFWIVFLLLLFLDGCIVACANMVDIDCGGVDLLAKQYNVTHLLNEKLRAKYSSIHELTFDVATICGGPLTGVFAVLLQAYLHLPDTVALIFAISIVFLGLTTYSLLYYFSSIPLLSTTSPHFQGYTHPPLKVIPLVTGSSIITHQPSMIIFDGKVVCKKGDCCQTKKSSQLDLQYSYTNVVNGFLKGATTCWRTGSFIWRILVLALETSLEDAVIGVIITEIAVYGLANNIEFASGALYAAGITAVAKIGCVLATQIMHRFWIVPETPLQCFQSVRLLCFCSCLGGICSLLLPLSNLLREENLTFLSLLTLLGGVFLFFLLKTPTKMGLATLVQESANLIDPSGHVIAFVAALLTFSDIICIIFFVTIFQFMSTLTGALIVSTGFLVCSGFITALVSPDIFASPLTLSDFSSELLLNPST